MNVKPDLHVVVHDVDVGPGGSKVYSIKGECKAHKEGGNYLVMCKGGNGGNDPISQLIPLIRMTPSRGVRPLAQQKGEILVCATLL